MQFRMSLRFPLTLPLMSPPISPFLLSLYPHVSFALLPHHLSRFFLTTLSPPLFC